MDQRTTLTFDALAQKMGRDISLKACRAINRAYRRVSRAQEPRNFPEEVQILHRALVEAQAPGFTVSQPKEVSDEAQFSSRGLTDWYVEQFVKLNHLK